MRLSPEEPFFARLKAMHRDMKKTNGVGEAIMKDWARDVLTTPMLFEFHPKTADNAWSRSINLREQLVV